MKILPVSLLAILYIILSVFASVEAENESVKIFSFEDTPFGLPYEDHVKNFWKYEVSLPIDKNPIKDPTGEKCTNGQENSNSSVFYLSGGGGGKHERTCTIPFGKAVLIPVMTVEMSDKEMPNASIDDLHKITRNDQDHVTSLYLEINGQKIQDLDKYRTHTGDFEVVFPENAIFGVSVPGISKVVADGFYVITEPLPKGKHTILWKSSLFCPGVECLEVNYAQDIKYNIIVE